MRIVKVTFVFCGSGIAALFRKMVIFFIHFKREETKMKMRIMFYLVLVAIFVLGAVNSFAAEDAGEPFQEDLIDLLGTEGQTNTFYGNGAGTYFTTGTGCSFFGALAGYRNTTGTNNTFVGYGAGIENVSGSKNVFIGANAGGSETGSEKLYIANTNTTSPLIYGDFGVGYLQINGQLLANGASRWGFAPFVLGQDEGNKGVVITDKATTNPKNIYFGWETSEMDYAEIDAVHEGVAPKNLVLNSSGGNVGIGFTTPDQPLEMRSGAYCSSGGVWTNASSREYKKDIKELTGDEAIDALKELSPVKFSYKSSSDEKYVGFIAEDVPELVATKNRKGMSAMDVVAVLTKVVQEQQKTISDLSKEMAELKKELKSKGPLTLAEVRLED
jgi:hypothetical protein